jgi:DNA topoisomerase-2
MEDLSKKYKKHELRDHIYNLPDTYIGSIDKTQLETFLYDEESKKMVKKVITYVPGLFKIFDETIVNASDHIMRLKEEIKNKKDDVRLVKNIKVNIDKKTGRIEVFNDGDGIDVEKHSEHNVYIPELIFGQLLTSTNYDQNVEKLWGGKNGYGSKLTNIFSREFSIETVDHRRKKMYSQTFSNNMKTIEKPTVKACSKAPYTKISFLPDYKKFGIDELTDDIYDLFHKRTFDIAATSDATVSVYFNDIKIDIKNFEKYMDLFIGTKEQHPRVFEIHSDRWEIGATYSDTHQFDQISFCNGINTSRGGKHVEYIANQITKRLSEMATSKMKREVKTQHIKDNLMVFIKCLIVNPSFDTQTKEALTTPVGKFGSKCDLSDKFYNALYKSGIIEKAVSLTDFHQEKKLSKTDGKKKNKLYVMKLDDANNAGTKDSEKCTLILTEGDSAKTMAISGLSEVGRDYYGVFPLRGKLLNVKDALASKISGNEEITNLKKILGLQQNKKYTDLSDLRYGRIMIMTDQDTDGFHIRGLLFNIFQSLWPSLFQYEKFLTSMLTPIIKVTKGAEVVQFYSLTDYEKWKRQHEKTLKQWKLKYYKGLGTSKENEAKEYFRDMKVITYKYTGKDSDEGIDLAFNKKRADDRKEWLKKYDPEICLDFDERTVPYEEFINKELIHFSNADLERSINHVCDGLKESTRKILFAGFKRKLYKEELKVARFAAYVAEVSAYHHGEASLQQAIIGMAQNYIGSNNINLLVPNGQFGTRIKGGSDSASPRYIDTLVCNLTRHIYREEDFPILNYLNDDGQSIEPSYYIPIIPMVLVNGAMGIGTGFSTNVPCFNPSDIIDICINLAKSYTDTIDTFEDVSKMNDVIQNIHIREIVPWYLGFNGTIYRKNDTDGSYVSKGNYTFIDDQTVEITELPIGKWTEDYKDFLTEMINEGSPVLKDFENHYTTKTVKFILKFYPGVKNKIMKSFENDFQLITSKSLSLNNIHLYNEKGAVTNYKTIHDVIRYWASIRIGKYLERKIYQINAMEEQYKFISAKVKFIQDVIDDVIILKNKKSSEIDAKLKELEYPLFSDKTNKTYDDDGNEIIAAADYKYLRSMPIDQVSSEKKAQLEKQANDLFVKIQKLKEKKIQTIWIEELNELKQEWEKYKNEIEKEYEDDRLNRKSVGVQKKRAIKKK